jgi:hypothetical protein
MTGIGEVVVPLVPQEHTRDPARHIHAQQKHTEGQHTPGNGAIPTGQVHQDHSPTLPVQVERDIQERQATTILHLTGKRKLSIEIVRKALLTESQRSQIFGEQLRL